MNLMGVRAEMSTVRDIEKQFNEDIGCGITGTNKEVVELVSFSRKPNKSLIERLKTLLILAERGVVKTSALVYVDEETEIIHTCVDSKKGSNSKLVLLGTLDILRQDIVTEDFKMATDE